jgi:hypothetical protein
VRRGDRARRLLRALQRRRDDVHEVVPRDGLGDRQRLALPALGEVIAGQAAVEDLLGVVHFAVPQQVDDGGHLTASAAARAAAGRAASITENASSSMAALTNQASYALGGPYTPASSNAWKNAGYRHVSDACAPA